VQLVDIIQFIPFVRAFEYPLFYKHYNHESDVTIIPSTMETHQGDLLGGALFASTHFRALHSAINHFHPL